MDASITPVRSVKDIHKIQSFVRPAVFDDGFWFKQEDGSIAYLSKKEANRWFSMETSITINPQPPEAA